MTIATLNSQQHKIISYLEWGLLVLYNLKACNYGNKIHLEVYTSPIKRTQVKQDNKITDDIVNKIKIIEDLEDDIRDSRSKLVSSNRCKNRLVKIARSNNWDLFITITFDRTKINAADYDLVAKKVTNWLNNIKKRRCPDMRYILVPEFHKDGINYHFHGLLADVEGLALRDSGHKDFAGNIIYNIENWDDIGFSTATYVKDPEKVQNYICKYISKDLLNRLKYKKRYFASRNCNVIEDEEFNIIPDDLYKLLDPEMIDYAKTVDIDGINKIRYFEIDPSSDIMEKLREYNIPFTDKIKYDRMSSLNEEIANS